MTTDGGGLGEALTVLEALAVLEGLEVVEALPAEAVWALP